MLTGIYVYESTTLKFQTSEPVVLTSFSQHATTTASGSPLQVSVTRGIYKIETNASIHPETLSTSDAGKIAFFECTNIKDAPPEPPSLAREMYDTKSQLASFFVSPDIKSAGFPSSQPESSPSVG